MARRGRHAAAKRSPDEELEIAFAELDIEVKRRCDNLEADAQKAVTKIKTAFTTDLLRIPRSIKGMSMRQFMDEFGGDMQAVLASAAGIRRAMAARGGAPATVLRPRNVAPAATVRRPGKPGAGMDAGAHKPPLQTVRRPRLGGNGPLATPGRGRAAAAGAAAARGGRSVVLSRLKSAATPYRLNPRLPTTPSMGGGVGRLPKRGETLLSANGSPVEVGDVHGAARASIVVRAGDPGAGAASAEAEGEEEPMISVDVELNGGTTVDLSNPSAAQGLSKSDKEVARAQVEALQAQLQSILTSLK